MLKKTWVEKRDGLDNLLKAAEHNKKVATDDIEDLKFLISAYEAKIESLKN